MLSLPGRGSAEEALQVDQLSADISRARAELSALQFEAQRRETALAELGRALRDVELNGRDEDAAERHADEVAEHRARCRQLEEEGDIMAYFGITMGSLKRRLMREAVARAKGTAELNSALEGVQRMVTVAGNGMREARSQEERCLVKALRLQEALETQRAQAAELLTTRRATLEVARSEVGAIQRLIEEAGARRQAIAAEITQKTHSQWVAPEPEPEPEPESLVERALKLAGVDTRGVNAQVAVERFLEQLQAHQQGADAGHQRAQQAELHLAATRAEHERLLRDARIAAALGFSAASADEDARREAQLQAQLKAAAGRSERSAAVLKSTFALQARVDSGLRSLLSKWEVAGLGPLLNPNPEKEIRWAPPTSNFNLRGKTGVGGAPGRTGLRKSAYSPTDSARHRSEAVSHQHATADFGRGGEADPAAVEPADAAVPEARTKGPPRARLSPRELWLRSTEVVLTCIRESKTPSATPRQSMQTLSERGHDGSDEAAAGLTSLDTKLQEVQHAHSPRVLAADWSDAGPEVSLEPASELGALGGGAGRWVPCAPIPGLRRTSSIRSDASSKGVGGRKSIVVPGSAAPLLAEESSKSASMARIMAKKRELRSAPSRRGLSMAPASAPSPSPWLAGDSAGPSSDAERGPITSTTASTPGELVEAILEAHDRLERGLHVPPLARAALATSVAVSSRFGGRQMTVSSTGASARTGRRVSNAGSNSAFSRLSTVVGGRVSTYGGSTVVAAQPGGEGAAQSLAPALVAKARSEFGGSQWSGGGSKRPSSRSVNELRERLIRQRQHQHAHEARQALRALMQQKNTRRRSAVDATNAEAIEEAEEAEEEETKALELVQAALVRNAVPRLKELVVSRETMKEIDHTVQRRFAVRAQSASASRPRDQFYRFLAVRTSPSVDSLCRTRQPSVGVARLCLDGPATRAAAMSLPRQARPAQVGDKLEAARHPEKGAVHDGMRSKFTETGEEPKRTPSLSNFPRGSPGLGAVVPSRRAIAFGQA